MKTPGNGAGWVFRAIALAAGTIPCRADAPGDSEGSRLGAESAPRPLTEMSLEELLQVEVREVRTASRYLQATREAPASVTVLTAEDFRNYGYRTLADALRSVRSVHVTYDRNYSYLGMRGFGLASDYNNRVLFLVDGHRLNDNIYDGALFGNEFILDAESIDRVEIVRGPGSSLYGSNAFFGVVNVLTKRGEQLDGAELSASAGSFGAYRGRASYGRRLEDGADVLVSGSYHHAEGQTLYFPEFDDPATGNGYAREADGERAGNAFARVSYEGLTLQGAFVSRAKHVPTGPYGTAFPSTRTVTWDDRGYLDLSFERTFEDRLSLLARVYLDGYWYRGDYEYEDTSSGTPVRYINKDSATGLWWGGEAQVTRPFLDDRVILTGGLELRHNLRQDQSNYDDLDPKQVYLDSREDSWVFAAYGQADVAVADPLRLNAGVRYDYYSTYGRSITPRVALVARPVESTSLKALYGRAFRAPSAYELYYSDNGVYQKAPGDLDPETVDSWELAVEQDLARGVRVIGAGFYNSVSDLIATRLDPADGLVTFDNLSRARVAGGEIEVQARLECGLSGRVSYSYQDARLRHDVRLENCPRNLVKLNLTAPLVPDRLFAGLEVQYVDRRRGPSGGEISGYWVANATLRIRELAPRLELSASLYNLFNRDYDDPSGTGLAQEQVEQDPLGFRIQLTWRF